MPHKFEAKDKNKLDTEWRRQNLPPLPTLEKLGLKASDTFADIGCGIGYFTVPAAQFVDGQNKVYALDTSAEMLAETEKRAAEASVGNMITVLTDENDLKLPDASVTFALMVNVLHEIEDKQRFIREINRILALNGKIAVIEWNKENTDMGPPAEQRIGNDEVAALLNALGFKVGEPMEFAGKFYGLVAVKNKDL
jgi:ubiquinone/menaquinone biosynthesis C-methylase UbiE